MKLTLRKANAVQAAINEAVKALDLNTSVTFNEFEEVNDQLQAVRDRFWETNDSRNTLMQALYEIRSGVAEANASAGINDMLASVAYLEKQINYNNMLASKGVQTSMQVLNGQIKKNAEVKDDGYGYNRRDVVTSIFTEEEVAKFRKDAADFKRQKQAFQDRLLELNVQTEIELSKVFADFLVKVGIL